jgi:hypothetical protein
MSDFVPSILWRMPIARQWDDHDSGLNNLDKNYPDWSLTQQAFLEYTPTYPLPSVTPGIWQQFGYAQADFFVLDCRSQRDPGLDSDGPEKSMLDGNNRGSIGELEWLKNGLLTSAARWKIIFTSVVMMGGLMIWGLQPGPMLFTEQPDFVWGLIASMYLGNIAGLIVVLTCVPLFAAILRVPFSIIAPVILVICAIGAYTVHNSMFDVWLMLVFGVMGYVFKKLDYPLAPLVLALVLGDRAEDSFRQTMLISQGDLRIFYSNWLVGSISGLAMVLLFWPLVSKIVRKLRGF